MSADPGAGLGHADRGPQADFLVFDAPPQSLDEELIAPRPLAIHADLERAGSQHLDDVGRCELAALVRQPDYIRAAGGDVGSFVPNTASKANAMPLNTAPVRKVAGAPNPSHSSPATKLASSKAPPLTRLKNP